MSLPIAVGIHLGSASCSVGYCDESGVARLARLKDHAESMSPRVVRDRHRRWVTGNAAQRLAFYGDTADHVVKNPLALLGLSEIQLGDERFSPAEIVAVLLRALVENGGLEIGQIGTAALTIPPSYDRPKTEALKRAALLAEIANPIFVPEPIAAIQASIPEDSEGSWLVYDLGHTSFNVAVVERNSPLCIAASGGLPIGGEDWTQALAELVSQKFQDHHQLSLRDNPRSWRELMEQCERAKLTFSEKLFDRQSIPVVFRDHRDTIVSSETVTRQEFEERTRPLVEETLLCTEELLRRWQMKSDRRLDDLSGSVLAGRSARMPMIQKGLSRLFAYDSEPLFAEDSALGAALVANQVRADEEQSQESLLTNFVAMKSFGVIVGPGDAFSVLIARGTPLPAVAQRSFLAGGSPNGSLIIPLAEAAENSIGHVLLGNLHLEVPDHITENSRIDVQIGLNEKSEIDVSAFVVEAGVQIVARLDQSGRERGSRARSTMEGYRFAVFYCAQIPAGHVGSLIAYAYSPKVNVRDLAEEAAERVERPAGGRLSAGVPQSTAYVARNDQIAVTVEVEGLVFQSQEACLALWSDQQSVEFRFRCPESSAGKVLNGFANYWLGRILIATVQLRFVVAGEDLPKEFRDALAEVNATPYRKVFPSYSHDDTQIVEQLELYSAAFGDTYLRDVKSLRTGQSWNPELLRFIRQADIFQLFWSPCAAKSDYVRQEWEAALLERTVRNDPYFVRPVFWTEKPIPSPPHDLNHLHFARLPIN